MSARAAWRLESMGFAQVYRYEAGKLDWLANGLPSEGTKASSVRGRELAVRDVPTCTLDESMEAVRQRAQASAWKFCVVVNAQRVVLGLVSADALGDGAQSIEQVMNPAPRTYRLDVGLEQLGRYFGKHAVNYVLITTSDGELFGAVPRAAHERATGEAAAT